MQLISRFVRWLPFLGAALGFIWIIFLLLPDHYQRAAVRSARNSITFISESETEEKKPITVVPSSESKKWIVVTSIQYPTENVKYLASLPGWTLVVVADKKTPPDWHLDGVHFLSIDDQVSQSESLRSIAALPYNSYTRKNAGYLYAILNGAEWIYDTDDDNVPYDRGLDEFDFTDEISGLRFQLPDGAENVSISNRLFNPYLHFGVENMWPRGFPLENIQDHSHRDGSYRLCGKMQRPAVQQGVVRQDPDVDAIYRLLHASKQNGLHEEFHAFAPTVTLAPGSYAPWNSQNTLFHKSAFFGLFLPTTVAFRVTDIWRGYFTQALLHMTGQSLSFVAANAVQARNAHNYLKDFHQELDVYEKSGELVEFLSAWKCTANSTYLCIDELASQFQDRGFWGDEDRELVHLWIEDLKGIGYEFPPMLSEDDREGYFIDSENRLRNCRNAHFHARMDLPKDKNSKKELLQRASDRIRDFSDLQEWCANVQSPVTANWSFPSALDAAEIISGTEAIMQKYETVAIMTNNYPWKYGMGMLQRLYESSFGLIIFCGPYNTKNFDSAKDANYPPLRTPINYVDVSEQEMVKGIFAYACLNKVAEMRLRNVKGYVMFSDDAIFNPWMHLDLNVIYDNQRYERDDAKTWWTERPETGIRAAKKAVGLLRSDKADERVKEAVATYEKLLTAANYSWYGKPLNTLEEHITTMDSWIRSDLIYMPSSNLTFFKTISEAFFEAKLFHEIVFSKFMAIMPNKRLWNFNTEMLALRPQHRPQWAARYNGDIFGLHPVKLTRFMGDKDKRLFCDRILDVFHSELFGR